VALTRIGCAAGVAPPVVYAKDMVEGDAVNVDVVTVELLTTRVTLVVTGLPVAPVEVVVTAPL